jgi:peptidyl-tRNA hydrolase, PTH1 family
MYLVVGLGNPGPSYAGHRHNVGFRVVSRLADKAGAPEAKSKFKGLHTRATIAGRDVVLLLPQTYMNVSGESVRPAADFFRVPPENVVVVHDELDLPFGEVRIKVGGGLAGHNGLRSIAQHLGTQDFIRVRFGIGRPRSGAVVPYVLGDFSSDERVVLETHLDRAISAVEQLVAEGPERAMAALHTKTKPAG